MTTTTQRFARVAILPPPLALTLLVFGMLRLSAALPPGFTEQAIVGPWNEPVGLTFEPEQKTSGGRMYVWERPGRVWIVENSNKLEEPLIDIREEVGAWRDFGLLGFALDPQFRQNGYIYLAYTVDHHHLTKFGTTNYNAANNEYMMATIHRITRYTVQATNDFRTVDYASRKILVGESISNGFPSLFWSHGIGTLIFAPDGTLLAGCGDGASHIPNNPDIGSFTGSYYFHALAEGIIQPKENIGAFRAQLVDSLSGKIIRIDPATGDGIPGNPFFDPAAPRSARSRVWSLGLRNPFRFTLRPGTGSHQRSDANPGVLYIGDSGWNTREDINVATGPGQNFGWPIFEGLEVQPRYANVNVNNQDAANPLFGVADCAQQFFHFQNLIVQDSLQPLTWLNPCDTNQHVPTNLWRFVHRRPVLDWLQTNGPARTGIYTTNGVAAVSSLGDPGCPVSGPQFGGSSSIGGTWYHGSDFPPQYSNTYFQADFEGEWMQSFTFDVNDNLISVAPFLTNGGRIVCIATHPVDGGLYYVTWTNVIKKISYVSNGEQGRAILKYLGRDGTGAIRWQLMGQTNRIYTVEGSTNLVGWSSITNVQPAEGTAEFIDFTAATQTFRFYRAVLLP